MNQDQTASTLQRPHPEERSIKLHGAEDFEGMRKAGRLAAEVLDFITPEVKPGVTTDKLDRLIGKPGRISHHTPANLARLRYKGQELKPQVRDVFSGSIHVRFVRDRGGRVTGLLAGTDRARNVRFRRLPDGARSPETGDGARVRRGAAKGE